MTHCWIPRNQILIEPQTSLLGDQRILFKLNTYSNVSSYNFVGQNITWYYVVTNLGNKDVKNILVNSDFLHQNLLFPLLPIGAKQIQTVNYKITQADLNNNFITNKSIATESEGSRRGTTWNLNMITPSLLIRKDSNLDHFSHIGQILEYQYEIFANTDLNNVIVKDGTYQQTLNFLPANSITKLKHNYIVTKEDYNRGYINDNVNVTSDTINKIDIIDIKTQLSTRENLIYDNYINAFANNEYYKIIKGNELNLSASSNINITKQIPLIKIIQSANIDKYHIVGQVINYYYQIINLSSEAINKTLHIIDDKVIATNPRDIPYLLPFQSVQTKSKYIVTGEDITNKSITNKVTIEYPVGQFIISTFKINYG